MNEFLTNLTNPAVGDFLTVYFRGLGIVFVLSFITHFIPSLLSKEEESEE